MWAVTKKELKDYFLSPIGYVVIGIFLLCFSVFFMASVMAYNTVDLGGLYYNTALIGLIIIAPILTMRMFAEERKTGTEQLLLTSPISMFKVVMGKFLAALIVVLITLILSLIYFAILCTLGKPNIVTTLVQILGFIFMSMAAISVGMFASSLTENQIISGVITIAFLLLSIFMDDINSKLSGFKLINYYTNFAKGVISLEDIISLVLFSFVFISLTIIVMQRRKLVK